MPLFVADKVQAALNDHSKPVKGSRIHVMGVAYKRDISGVRESPALDILALLAKRGAVLSYSDPPVPRLNLDGLELCSEPMEEGAKNADCVVIVTDLLVGGLLSLARVFAVDR